MNNTLLELNKRHKEWLAMAIKICKCNEIAKDLVQEMYIKIYNCKPTLKKNYENLIYTIIKNIYKDYIKKQYTYKYKKEIYRIDFVEYNHEIL